MFLISSSIIFILLLSPLQSECSRHFGRSVQRAQIAVNARLQTHTHTHKNTHTHTHTSRSGSSGFKERTTGVSWRLQVTNTGTEELIHGGERGHLTVKKLKTLHSCIESTHTHTHTHTLIHTHVRSQSHSCKNKK